VDVLTSTCDALLNWCSLRPGHTRVVCPSIHKVIAHERGIGLAVCQQLLLACAALSHPLHIRRDPLVLVWARANA
jgi:hypothetical protein